MRVAQIQKNISSEGVGCLDAEGKRYAEIYDFVTIPRPIEQVKNLHEDEVRSDISLVEKEIERVRTLRIYLRIPKKVTN